jgi:hypothetical protein
MTNVGEAPQRTEAPAAAAPRPRVTRLRLTLLAACAVALLAATAWLPWEWSFIDDSSLIAFTDRNVGQHGRLGALWPAAEELYQADRMWGLFRPMFWISVAAFYQLPVGPAHAVRLGMLAVVFVGAIVTVTRGTSGQRRLVLSVWTALVVLSIGSLFANIWYPSLQELSGLFFVSLGLLAWRRPWLVALCWLVAAWFKTPFAWLLLAYGLLLLLRRGGRVVGAVSAVVAAGTIAAAVRYARVGTYTSDRVGRVQLDALDQHVLEAARGFLRPGAVIVLGAVLLLPRIRWRRIDLDSAAVPLIVGGLGYLANLLPWRVDGYYAGPFVFLLSLGALLLLRDIRPATSTSLSRARIAAALVLPALVAVHGFSQTVRHGWSTHATVTGLRDCVRSLPDGSIVGFNRDEAWIRLHAIVKQHSPTWTGQVVRVPDGETVGRTEITTEPRLDYYIHQPSYGPGTPALMTGPVVCRTPQATVYRVTT